jgi:hypothetical protein
VSDKTACPRCGYRDNPPEEWCICPDTAAIRKRLGRSRFTGGINATAASLDDLESLLVFSERLLSRPPAEDRT